MHSKPAKTAGIPQPATTMHKSLLVLTAAALIMISSCTDNSRSGQFHPIDADAWLYGDTLSFTAECNDTVWHGDIAVAIRHTASYPYSNIWLEISYPDLKPIVRDTVNIRLADNLGNWYGHGSGLSFQCVDTVARNLTLPSPVTVNLRHIMRTDRLTDIEQVGIMFQSTDN